MKYSKRELLNTKDNTIYFDESINFESSNFVKMKNLKGLSDVSVSGNLRYEPESDLVFADLDVEGTMTVPCSISLENVDLDFHTTSLETFTFSKEQECEYHVCKGDFIELLPVIFQLIVLEIPLKVVKPGLIDYPKGDGWEVVKEEDFIKNKEKEIDPRLAKLKDFKINKDK